MNKITKVAQVLRKRGLLGTLKLVKNRLRGRRIKNYRVYQELLQQKAGIEIGGPSGFFSREVPVYDVVKSLDGVNFSSSTVWEGELTEGPTYTYGQGRTGHQFICDAVNLERIQTGTYDFVLSCNNLEHIANPLKALTEWLRILKPEGMLLLVLPFKESNFDHQRSYTTMAHLLDDFRNNTSEEDLAHLPEILELHDLSMDAPAGDFENFRKRSLANFQNRCLHHHVFSLDLLEEIFHFLQVEVIAKDSTDTDLIILGRKTS
ncbi:class I SAM-dependent methyltransferase [Rufibacter sediminis]|uniref:Methyltransferase domain-containing protein n=1 Tax=Rufibacter sediminis TaxID=2762756 RepID=A0ABR6VYE9_9BACT|nr:methyltransferase domain-containing protein [Rufibacter sediminis]MBC3542180.1 methyltransferase domain-containing protein [Rufibacter sediminis]